MSIDVVFLNILHVNYFWWSNSWKPFFLYVVVVFSCFLHVMCVSNLRNSPRGVPRTPNRLMHDAYVRKFDAFLKVIYFGKSFGLWMFPKIMVFPPKSSINRVFHYFHHPFWGTTVVGNIHIGDEILPSYMRSLLQPLKINQDFTVYPPCSLKRSQRSYPWKWMVGIRFCFLLVRLCLFSGANS